MVVVAIVDKRGAMAVPAADMVQHRALQVPDQADGHVAIPTQDLVPLEALETLVVAVEEVEDGMAAAEGLVMAEEDLVMRLQMQPTFRTQQAKETQMATLR